MTENVKKKEVPAVKGTTISQAQIDEWKAEYGYVYKTMDGNKPIIYRPIRRDEYRQLMLDTDIPIEEENNPESRFERLSSRQIGICEITVLFPFKDELTKMLNNKAGLASSLANEIMDHSGFDTLAKTEEL